MVDPKNQGRNGSRGWRKCSCDDRYVRTLTPSSTHVAFNFHLPLDEGTATSGFKGSKRALCRTRHEVPEKQVDLFRRVQLVITLWACCRKELGHTNPAGVNMHKRAGLCLSYPLSMLQIAHVIRLPRGQTRTQELGIPVHPGKH